MSAPKFGLDNLTVFLDYNQGQIDGPTRDIMNLDPLADKWTAFNWDVQEIDGHDISKILSALDKTRSVLGKPHLILAHTVKGKGVSFMEGNIDWHGKAPTRAEAEQALREIESAGID
ncbi:MAG: hypothetical protein A2636_03715 [Elusimicrobia bacterium RIFCSPHIGHO2_01_FULL_64_10]|nr:MAG: hypothetical protein A2636_03715 [Elusimicrobia bacterium RIFCSPHIGHO2_01_FULL_64_10]